MAIQIQLRQGTTTEHDTFTGAVGELTYDTVKKQLRVHDGITVGGKIVDDPTRNVTSQVSNTTETIAGKAEIATQAETNTGTDDSRIVTPKKLLAGVKNHLNASGNAPMYACRAWVNFNGTGTVAIRASGNVSSITDNGIADYTVNFTAAMQDINYSVVGSGSFNNTESWAVTAVPNNTMTTSVRVLTKNAGVASADLLSVNLAVFR